MKESELRKHLQCNICNKKLGQTGLPMFWVVKALQYALDLKAIERQQGLSMMMGGNAVLAGVMGPDEDMAKSLGDTVEITICSSCMLENKIGFKIYEKQESMSEDAEE